MTSSKSTTSKAVLIISIFLLLLCGHVFAKLISSGKDTAWLYALLFYAGWLIVSQIYFLNFDDIKQMFKPSLNWQWNLLPLLFIIPTIIFLFIPNLRLLQWDKWLLMNAIICIVGPFLEEIYWRGLITKFFGWNILSFLISTTLFAASHPLIFGVNSKGDSGLVAFIGTFIVGATWWICYYKTKSLRGNVVTHFLVDVFAMAVYVLANKAILLHL